MTIGFGSLDIFLVGWGVNKDYCKGGTRPTYLQELDMQILPQDTCREFEGWYDQYNATLKRCVRFKYSLKGNATMGERIVGHILCAKNPTIGKSTCEGDSGGPLTVKQKDGRHVLVGVSNAGAGCGLVSFHPSHSIHPSSAMLDSIWAFS